MKSKKNILFVSVSSDMYGSSKVLLSLVLRIHKQSETYNPIVCMPLEPGPLKDILKREGIQTIEMPVVKLTRSLLKSLKFYAVLREYWQAKKIFQKATKGMTVDLIQSNTLATLFGAFYCMFRKPKHIVHVHEIMDRPKIVHVFFKNVLRFFSDYVVYNSIATANFYNGIARSLRKKSITIVNGVDRNEDVTTETQKLEIRRHHFHANNDHFLIGLVGRINRLKGHSLLLKAFQNITEKFPQARLCFIGSPPPGQENYLTNLREEIANSNVSNKVEIIDFQQNIFSIMESLDVVVVPSTEPESFGLVVVEAMLSGRAVIGSDIGGISTIIDHNRTGLLFESDNNIQLSNAITSLIEDPAKKERMEISALQMAKEDYSTERLFEKFNQLYNTLI